MKRVFLAALAFASAAATALAADEATPEWVYKIRMVSVSHEPRQGSFDRGRLKAELEAFKAAGVNTIMAHGSFQFIPGLPAGRGQWQRPVDYDIAIPYSEAIREVGGLKHFHHTTSTFVPIEAMEKPEYRPWVSCDIRTGEPSLRKPGTSYGNACFMDMNHPGFRAFLFARMKEYAEKCRIDGWMTDEVEWLADIYAGGSPEGSWKQFKERYGHAYPTGEFDPDKPEWRKYLTFRYDSGGDFYRALLASLREVNPTMQISGCLAGISKYHRRIWAMGSENYLKGWTLGFFEMEEGHHPRKKPAGYLSTSYWPIYYREMALYNANGEINGWPCSYALGYPATWKVPNSEQFYLWAQTLSMGFRFWMRDYQAEPEWFAWEAKHEADLIKPRWINDVGVFFPEEARDFAGDPLPPYRNWSGLAETLARFNIPADQLVRGHFDDPARLSRFKAIILPSSRFTSDRMTATLRKYVSDGGLLIAVGEQANCDPFAAASGNDKLLPLLGIAEHAGWQDGKRQFQYQGKSYRYPDGMMQVKPLASARVLAEVPGVGPALIEHPVGKGAVLCFTGRWGVTMHSLPTQKGNTYKETANLSQRQLFADLVKERLAGRRRVEVRNLPDKVMLNAYDTDGDFDGRYRRTIHILDSFDGYDHGEEFPPENRPCRFKPFAERTEAPTVDFVLRDLAKINRVYLLSPDFAEPKELKAVRSQADNGFVIKVPTAEFGRYSILVVDKDE